MTQNSTVKLHKSNIKYHSQMRTKAKKNRYYNNNMTHSK